MPRKLSVGPRWLPSAVWLYTTSRMISIPASCRRDTVERNASSVLRPPRSGRLGREKADGVVAPVVVKPALDQVPVVDEGVDRKQLDRRDPEPLEMIDDGRCGEAAKCAAPRRRNVLALLRQPFDVGLINDGLFPRDRGPALLAPGERFVDDDGLRHSARIVPPVERQVGARAARAIAEMRIVPDEAAGELSWHKGR